MSEEQPVNERATDSAAQSAQSHPQSTEVESYQQAPYEQTPAPQDQYTYEQTPAPQTQMQNEQAPVMPTQVPQDPNATLPGYPPQGQAPIVQNQLPAGQTYPMQGQDQNGSAPEPPNGWQSNPYGQQPYPYGQPTNPNGQPYNPYGQPAGQNGQLPNQNPYDQQSGTPGDPQQDPQANPFLQSLNMFSNMSTEDAQMFASARKMVTVAQITALVSLLFGGVILSTASIVVAIMGYFKLSKIAEKYPDDKLMQGAIRRPGALAIIMSVLALILNAISLYAVYPMIMEAFQNGDFSSLFQSSPSGTAPTTTPSTPTSPGGNLWG